MPISVIWDDAQKTTIRLDYAAPVLSWAEYDSAVDTSYQLARSVPYEVCIIHNPGSVDMPKGSAFPHLRRAMRYQPENVRLMISVVTNPFVRALMPIVLRQMGNPNLIFARSLDEARATVQNDPVR